MRWALPLAVVAAAGVVVVGVVERGSRADEESAGMSRVLSAVGPLDSPSLRGFRILADFQCLGYRRGRTDFALELCVDSAGRVVEAIDRRSGSPEIWSLRDDRRRSSVRVDRATVDALLLRMGVE